MKLVNLAIDNPGAEGKRKFQRWPEHEASPRMTRFLFSQYACASDVKMSQSDSSCKQAEKGVKESSHYVSQIYFLDLGDVILGILAHGRILRGIYVFAFLPFYVIKDQLS